MDSQLALCLYVVTDDDVDVKVGGRFDALVAELCPPYRKASDPMLLEFSESLTAVVNETDTS